jgi:hypothetical protein
MQNRMDKAIPGLTTTAIIIGINTSLRNTSDIQPGVERQVNY